MKARKAHGLLYSAVVMILLSGSPAHADYKKIDPPPDANKAGPATDDTCWLATAANMLAGAGYGVGDDVQQRAESIYNQLKAHFLGTA